VVVIEVVFVDVPEPRPPLVLVVEVVRVEKVVFHIFEALAEEEEEEEEEEEAAWCELFTRTV
jgi:hypothetical protein